MSTSTSQLLQGGQTNAGASYIGGRVLEVAKAGAHLVVVSQSLLVLPASSERGDLALVVVHLEANLVALVDLVLDLAEAGLRLADGQQALRLVRLLELAGTSTTPHNSNRNNANDG